MPLYRLKSGAHSLSGKTYGVNDEIELSEGSAESMNRDAGHLRFELVSKGEERRPVSPATLLATIPTTIDTVDWDSTLKSSSIGKILLVVKKTEDRGVLDAILAAEEKGQNREKIVNAIKAQLDGGS